MEENQAKENIPATEEPVTEPVEFEKKDQEPASTPEEPVQQEPTEFEKLQEQFNQLQDSFNELQTKFEEAQNNISELETAKESLNTEFEAVKAENDELKIKLSSYEAKQLEEEEAHKNELFEKYENFLEEEEIKPIKDVMKDFSYGELEGKLAIIFANKQITGNEELKKVLLPEPEDNSFATFMKKYKK
jgi:chromosome segregation ATPase